MLHPSRILLNMTAWILAATALGRPGMLLAQEQQDQNQSLPRLLVVPAPLGGSSPQLLPTSEGQVSNVIGGGVTLGAVLDDNAFDLNGQRYAQYQYSVLPTLMFQQTRPQTAWSLDYRGGLTIDQSAFAAGPTLQQAASATADVQHSFGRRLVLELREDYVLTDNPFTYTAPNSSLAILSGPGQLNSFAVAPEARRTASVSSADTTYQLSQYSSMGFSGSYSLQSFSDVATGSPEVLSLIDTRTTTARGFYLRQVGQDQKIGVEYQFQDMWFQDGAARTVDQTLFLFDEIDFTTNMTLVMFAGPDCAHVHNNILLGSVSLTAVVPGINNLWSPAGGAKFTWRGKHVALDLTGQRVVTDGGGYTGSIRASSASGELRKDFTSRWAASLGYEYSDGRLLEGPSTGGGRITFTQASLALERRLTKDLSVRAQYARVQQLSSTTPTPLITGYHNRVEVDLVYQFTRPLGR